MPKYDLSNTILIDRPGQCFVDGKPVVAIECDTDEGWATVMVRDEDRDVLFYGNFKVVTQKVHGKVEFFYNDEKSVK